MSDGGWERLMSLMRMRLQGCKLLIRKAGKTFNWLLRRLAHEIQILNMIIKLQLHQRCRGVNGWYITLKVTLTHPTCAAGVQRLAHESDLHLRIQFPLLSPLPTSPSL